MKWRYVLVVVIVLIAITAITLCLYLNQPSPTKDFLVEDSDEERMVVQVNLGRQEVINTLEDLYESGTSKWIGGEIERFDNKFEFRFKPDTVVVSDITAEGLQASKFSFIQDDFDYWKTLKTIYIWGKVVEILN